MTDAPKLPATRRQVKGAREITWRALEGLLPYARNAKTHSVEQVAQIAGSIKAFGFNNPVLIDERGEIIAGHGRVLAAHELRMKTVPCIVLSHLSKAQKRAYRLADNRIAENGGWDDQLLKIELTAIQSSGLELDLGFSEKELARALGEADEQQDTAPQLGDGMQYRVVVDCTGETQQASLLAELEARGLTCRPLIS
jgi:ParB-like chromosome segregation protein Spo0J